MNIRTRNCKMVCPGSYLVLIICFLSVALVLVTCSDESADNSTGGTSLGSDTPTIPPPATPTPTRTHALARDVVLRFTDVSEQAGIILRSDGPHGVVVSDVDGDNFEDIYITRCCDGSTNLLYINQQDGTFLEEGPERGVADPQGKIGGSHGAVFIDYDLDGDYDLVSSGTYLPDRLYRNEGDGYFVELTEGIWRRKSQRQTRGIMAGDIDRDGDQDLYLVSLVCGDCTLAYENVLLLNEGDGTMTKDEGGRGLQDPIFNVGIGCYGAQGVTFGDIDLDGDIDLYVNRIDLSDRLYINDGQGYFSEDAFQRGVGHYNTKSNGALFADFDNDRDLDLVVQDIDPTYRMKFFINDGTGYFRDVTSDYGFFAHSYSGLMADFDNDGDQDYYVVLRTNYSPISMVMMVNDGHGIFTPNMYCGANLIKRDARSAAALDYDNDGDLDIMLIANKGGCNLLRNENNSDAYVKLKLIGWEGDAGAFGAIAHFYNKGCLGDPTHFLGMRQASSSQGYLSQSSPVLHFGLRKNVTAVDVELIFSTGHRIQLYELERGTFYTVDISAPD